MGIWIRSQDEKTLVSVKEIYVTRRSKGWCICTGRGFDLGAYSTEEKAIKVLDMIHDDIRELSDHIVIFSDILIGPKVFQMPQDNEVKLQREQ